MEDFEMVFANKVWQNFLSDPLRITWNLKDNIPWVSYMRKRDAEIVPEWILSTQSGVIKTRLQYEANMAHKAADRWGLICGATGIGKSKIAIDAVSSLVNVKNDAKLLLVVPTQKLRDTGWRDEFSTWDATDIFLLNVTTVCYDSLHKISGQHFDFVILDEVHNIVEANMLFFISNRIDACMALTATMPKRQDKITLLQSLKLYKIFEVTLDEAVALGVVAPYEITIVEIPLDKVNKNVKAGRKDKPFMVTEVKAYEYYRKIELDNSKPKSKFFYINRMRFIYDLRSKTEAAQYLLTRISEKLRTVIFTGGISQADELCPHRYHSNSGDESYNLFQCLGGINWISCVNSLNEGHNLRSPQCAFIVQLNSNDLNLIQRIGRTIRYRPNYIAKVIILCAKGTVDEAWVRSATEELDETRIKRVQLSDIKSGVVDFKF